MAEKNHVNIELRSEDVRDILSRAPGWMISWGNTVILVIMIIGLFMSYFMKYPDVILGSSVISTESPPLYIGSKVAGRVNRVLVQNGQWVKEGEVLIELQNPVNTETILFLEEFIGRVNACLADPRIQISYDKSKLPQLYDAKNQFLQIINEVREYQYFLLNKSSLVPREALIFKLNQARQMERIGQREVELAKTDIDNAKEQFSMQEQEYKKGYITRLAFLNAQSVYNQSLKQQESLKKTQLQFEATLFDLKNQLEEFDQVRLAKTEEFRQRLEQGVSNLENFIVKWENDYIIKSPAAGQVEFLQRVEEKQSLPVTSQLMAIIQEKESFEVIAVMPREGFGKVRKGNQVRMKVDNYPAHEYGVLAGEVISISSLSRENQYTVKISLTQGLKTSYNKELKYTPEMTATAEIVTDDLRLIERLFNSVRALFVN